MSKVNSNSNSNAELTGGGSQKVDGNHFCKQTIDKETMPETLQKGLGILNWLSIVLKTKISSFLKTMAELGWHFQELKAKSKQNSENFKD